MIVNVYMVRQKNVEKKDEHVHYEQKLANLAHGWIANEIPDLR